MAKKLSTNAKVLIGIGIFVLVIVLWFVSGKKSEPESVVLDYIKGRLRS